jgi:hypothetical protein
MNARTRWYALLLAACVMLLGGCGDNLKQASAPGEVAPKLAGPSLANVPGEARGTELIITYKVSGLNRRGEIKVFDNGVVEVFQWGIVPVVPEGQSSMWESYPLPPERVSSLINQFREAGFFEFDSAYVEQDPPGVANEYDWRTLTFYDDGRGKSIRLRGSSQVPARLNELLQEITELWRKPTS